VFLTSGNLATPPLGNGIPPIRPAEFEFESLIQLTLLKVSGSVFWFLVLFFVFFRKLRKNLPLS
jgi:hypothetical protein